MYEENLEQAKRRMVTSTQTGELAIHPFLEKFLAEAEPGTRAPRREELKSFADALVVLETSENDATNVRSQDESASAQGRA